MVEAEMLDKLAEYVIRHLLPSVCSCGQTHLCSFKQWQGMRVSEHKHMCIWFLFDKASSSGTCASSGSTEAVSGGIVQQYVFQQIAVQCLSTLPLLNTDNKHDDDETIQTLNSRMASIKFLDAVAKSKLAVQTNTDRGCW